MPSPGNRTCRETERVWQGRYVDRNLTDDWLTSLNSLNVFRLVSVCEGHVAENGRRASCPHVNLRLRPELLRRVQANWDDLSVGLATELGRLVQPTETVAEAELRLGVRLGQGGGRNHSDFVIRLRGVRPRVSASMEPEIAAWFEKCIVQCIALDRLVANRLG